MTDFLESVHNLSNLGAEATEYEYDAPSISILETFQNPCPVREYTIEIVFPEFTSLCPKTGQPDFGTITIRYKPNKFCVESKSLKLYFFAFRQYGAFMEAIVNKVRQDLANALSPTTLEVVGKFAARGGTYITVTAKDAGETF